MGIDVNHVTIIGRLTRNAELKFTNGGTAITTISIANNEMKKTADGYEDVVSFFDVIIWGRTAEAIAQYLTKGKQVAIEGRLRQDRWHDRESGQPRSKVKITARTVQLLSGGGGGSSNPGNGAGYSTKDGHTSKDPDPPPTGILDYSNDDFNDDIPF